MWSAIGVRLPCPNTIYYRILSNIRYKFGQTHPILGITLEEHCITKMSLFANIIQPNIEIIYFTYIKHYQVRE